jgi:hypothetical protein
MIKKFIVTLLSLTMLLSTVVFAYAEETALLTTTETIILDDAIQITPLKVDSSDSINLSGGDTWKKKFDMNRWWPANPHDAFEIKVTDVTGSYKVLILGADGYYYSSNTYTDTGVTLTITNAKPDINYTVSVVNTSTNKELKAKITIKSYNE